MITLVSSRIRVTVVAPPGVEVEIEEDRFAESRTASLDPGTIVAPPTPDDPIVLRLYELEEAATYETRRRARLASSASRVQLQVTVPYTQVVTQRSIDDVRILAAEAGVDEAVLIVHARRTT